ncbi:Nif3-like dinuclear metal center hexameric protein [Cohnella nanjingensis]|uniref:GTP cyclohydrolase 1 type 2 homolog n=1 Tax=Cohnella nanjingensis TaxID=1387779 RepID=A0A7X0RPW8_9BACL|nr:Nif3-like dinuclear metal center hexameric protein [Cohnella nanjingensis]MBB6671390.1 Nif3-like dinuclear metal center hexameric protein [Cohnella nanjingensis]
MTIVIQEIIDRLWEPVATRPPRTVDALLTGDPASRVRGIAVAFAASQAVVERARDMGANLLIVHEGVYYSHMDRTDTLAGDAVYEDKRRFISQSGLAVYRFHDGIHLYRPDGITSALAQALGWVSFVDEHRPAATLLTLPGATVGEVAALAKERLGLPFVRVVGDPGMPCARVGLLAGYRGGGDLVIPLLGNEGLDLVLAGEGPEWESPEYVRDAVSQGKPKALILLGHAASEEPGMADLAAGLARAYPAIPVRFLPDKPVFQIY